MSKQIIPEKILEQLHCTFCHEYLSVFPVHMYTENNSVTCGRCPVLEEQNPIRNVCYEGLASVFLYPCRFRSFGCSDTLPPNEIFLHEDCCQYRHYYCPVMPLGSCPWQGPSNELIRHFLDSHKAYTIEKGKIELDLVNQYNENYLFPQFGNVFLFQVIHDIELQTLWFDVCFIGSKNKAKSFNFLIEFSNENSTYTHVLERTEVHDDSHLILDKTRSVHIATEDLKQALEDPNNIICSVRILASDFVNDSKTCDELDKLSISTDLNDEFLVKIECPVCSEHMVPPIYQCILGHSVCGKCKPTLSDCPTCRSKIENTRNYLLEDLTSSLKYPCKYSEYDCKYVASAKTIKEHESECTYGPYECPMQFYSKCKWKGSLKNASDHLREEHEDNIVDFDLLSVPFDENMSDDDCLVAMSYGQVFRISIAYMHTTKIFNLSVELVGPSSDCINYAYELDFSDDSGTDRMFFKKKCLPYAKNGSVFTNDRAFLKIPLYLVENFIIRNEFCFGCVIKKIV